MSTQTMSRILLSVLTAGAMLTALYFISGGYAVYGYLILIAGTGFLLWIWKPWKRSHKS